MDGFALVIPILHGTGQSLTETILHAEDPQVLYVKMTETEELLVHIKYETKSRQLRSDS